MNLDKAIFNACRIAVHPHAAITRDAIVPDAAFGICVPVTEIEIDRLLADLVCVTHETAAGHLSLLGAMSLAALVFSPWATALALRISLE